MSESLTRKNASSTKLRKPYGGAIESTFETISLAVMQGNTSSLDDEQRRVLETTKEAYHILCETPNKGIAVKKLSELHPEITEHQAYAYISYGIRIWNPHNKLDRDFLDTIFINALLKEIKSDDTDGATKAKNLATLQRYIAAMPQEPMDPMMMEKHDIFIQLNINGSTINVPADKWDKIKENKVIAAAIMEQEISEDQAAEIMEG